MISDYQTRQENAMPLSDLTATGVSLREALDGLPFQTFEVDHERGALLAKIVILEDMVRMQQEKIAEMSQQSSLEVLLAHRITDEAAEGVLVKADIRHGQMFVVDLLRQLPKYSIRFADESETSVRIIVEPIPEKDTQ
jgi:hypothetical protein